MEMKYQSLRSPTGCVLHTGLGKKMTSLGAKKAAGKPEVEEVLWDVPDQDIQRRGGINFYMREKWLKPAAWMP